MENDQTKLQLPNGQNLSTTKPDPMTVKVGLLMNKLRAIQNWNVLDPGDSLPLAAVWRKELERHGIAPALYNRLVELAVDYRSRCIRDFMPLPPLALELLIAMYDREFAENPMTDYFVVEITRCEAAIERLTNQGEDQKYIDSVRKDLEDLQEAMRTQGGE